MFDESKLRFWNEPWDCAGFGEADKKNSVASRVGLFICFMQIIF